jgi:hypothetical protein
MNWFVRVKPFISQTHCDKDLAHALDQITTVNEGTDSVRPDLKRGPSKPHRVDIEVSRSSRKTRTAAWRCVVGGQSINEGAPRGIEV